MEYTAEQKELMLRSKAWPDRWAMAREGYRLDMLVNDENEHVRQEVAEHGYRLDILIHDEDAVVRSIVAKQGYGLGVLVHDEDFYVRYRVAEQGYGLDILVKDGNWIVRDLAVRKMKELELELGNGKETKGNMAERENDGPVSQERIEKALECLRDNGVAEDECENVLQALGYILLDAELFPERDKQGLIGNVGELIEKAGQLVVSPGDGDGLTVKGKSDDFVKV